MAISTPRTIRSKRVQAIEKRHGKPLEQILRELYYEERLTQAEVAKRLHVPAGSVGGWLIRFGIDRTTLAEQAAKELSA